MAGYSGTPLWKRLGYKDELVAYVEGAPCDYIDALGLPTQVNVRWAKTPIRGIGFLHLFTESKERLLARLPVFRRTVGDDAVIWISWPKTSSGVTTDLTENVIREVALPLGLVDIKVCAIDEVWSGLKLMIRKELRNSAK